MKKKKTEDGIKNHYYLLVYLTNNYWINHIKILINNTNYQGMKIKIRKLNWSLHMIDMTSKIVRHLFKFETCNNLNPGLKAVCAI